MFAPFWKAKRTRSVKGLKKPSVNMRRLVLAGWQVKKKVHNSMKWYAELRGLKKRAILKLQHLSMRMGFAFALPLVLVLDIVVAAGSDFLLCIGSSGASRTRRLC
nr:MAG TPA: hypothetical protein [Caudoviricetes sp.]